MEESKFKFLGFRIKKVECEILDTFNTSSGKFSQAINIQNNFDKNNNRIVEVIVEVKVKSQDESFNCFVVIGGGFEAESEMSKDLFDNLAKVSAPAILFPFLRAFITSITAQANIPPIILPTVNFAAGSKMKKQVSTSKKGVKNQRLDSTLFKIK